MSRKREKRVRWCAKKRGKGDVIEVDAGRIVGEKHPALGHPSICSTYTGNADWNGETWVFIDGKPIEPLQAQYDRARKAGY